MAEDAIEEEPKKLVEKMNKQIDKQKDKLVLSAAKAFESTWGESLSKAIEETQGRRGKQRPTPPRNSGSAKKKKSQARPPGLLWIARAVKSPVVS